MRPAEANDYIRQMAVAGSGKQAAAAMVDALDWLLPARNKVLMWIDEKARPCDIYESDPLPAVRNAFFEQASLVHDPDEPSIEAIVRFPQAHGSWFPLQRSERWSRSLLLNELFRPYGVGNNYDFKFYHRGRPIGLLAIDREPGTPRLTREEIRRVAALAAHFAHSVLASPPPGQRWVQAPDLVTLTADLDGRILGLGPGAERALDRLARNNSSLIRSDRERVPRILQGLLDEFATPGRAGQLPPRRMLETEWGRFEVRAHLQQPARDRIVFTIENLRPLALHRIDCAAKLPLSPRERRLAVAMAGEASSDAIAKDFGITIGSYRQYALRIYNRLNVAGRAGVVRLFNASEP